MQIPTISFASRDATRLANLELLQQHGANLWRAHLHALDASSAHLKRVDGALGEQDVFDARALEHLFFF